MEINKIQLHEDIIIGMHNLYIAKNADYGDGFSKIRDKFPNAILIRLNDKLSRIETLMQGAEQRVKDESIDDTLTDLANYCILELIERRADKMYEKMYMTKAITSTHE